MKYDFLSILKQNSLFSPNSNPHTRSPSTSTVSRNIRSGRAQSRPLPYSVRYGTPPSLPMFRPASRCQSLHIPYPYSGGRRPTKRDYFPWHFLYFFPDPQGHGSFRPTFGAEDTPADADEELVVEREFFMVSLNDSGWDAPRNSN